MSVFYQQITPFSSVPADLGLGEDQRVIFSFNVIVVKRPSLTFEQEILKILESASVGTRNVDMFFGSNADVPTTQSDDPTAIIHMQATGGPAPIRTQNDVTPPAYERPTLKVLIRSFDYATARAKAFAALHALTAIRNVDITP